MQQTPDMNELIHLAQTPTGQKLIGLLQKQGGNRLQEAITSAVAGNYAHAKAILSELLSSPDAQALLKQLEEQK